MRRLSVAIGVGSIVVVLTGVTAVGVQAGAGSRHFAACSSKTGTLSLLKHGRCAAGASRVTLDAAGARGPRGHRGAAGPGEKTTTYSQPIGSAAATGPAVPTGIPGITVQPSCSPDTAMVAINGVGTYTLAGNPDLEAAEAADAKLVVNGPGGTSVNLFPGVDGIDLPFTVTTGQTLGVLAHLGSDNAATVVEGSFIVTTGGSTFTMQISLAALPAKCSATAVVTPTTVVTG